MNRRENVSRESVAAEVRAELARAHRSGRSAALELGWNQNYMWRRVDAIPAPGRLQACSL